MNNQSISKALDMPANLFSNLGGKSFATKINEPQSTSNIVKTNNELAEDMKEYYQSGDIKLNKLSNQKQYRNRLNKMYESLKVLSPIDSEVKDTLFTSNYIEKGIVIKPTIEEMKQFWTEYRLMNNEKTKEQRRYNNPTSLYTNKESDEFDVLFDKLTNKVTEINEYIDELKELKASVDKKEKEVAQNQEKLEIDRQTFLNYKQEEEEKIRKQKENLKNNFNKLQNIIDSLDTKLNEVE